MERNMDESRKQFAEAFEELTGWELEDYPDQAYADTCWEFWRMSREAIAIELPAWFVSEAIAVYDRDEVDEVFRAAGIKVKE